MEKTLYNKNCNDLVRFILIANMNIFHIVYSNVDNFVILLTQNNTYNSQDNQKDACDNIIKSMMAGNNKMTTAKQPKKKKDT